MGTDSPLHPIYTWKYSALASESYLWQIPPKSLDEASLCLPKGVYTTFRTYDGCRRVIGLQDHLTRLGQSAEGFTILNRLKASLLPAVDTNELRLLLRQILENFKKSRTLTEARVRINMDLSFQPGTIYISVQALNQLPITIFSQGVSLASSNLHRENPELKGTDFLAESRAMRQHMPEGIFELLLVNKKGNILEGMTSNFFGIRRGKMFTTGTGILVGVTRNILIEIAKKSGIRIIYKPVNLSALNGLDEAFITSSSRGIVPVVCIDDHVIRDGIPGPITKGLIEKYHQYVIQQAEFI